MEPTIQAVSDIKLDQRWTAPQFRNVMFVTSICDIFYIQLNQVFAVDHSSGCARSFGLICRPAFYSIIVQEPVVRLGVIVRIPPALREAYGLEEITSAFPIHLPGATNTTRFGGFYVQ